jgi:4-diphosphocytidyl-2-C-methyl-D-erythritol kinase
VPEQRLLAPAKLTLSLRITRRRADGYHELSSEMVSIDLCDELVVDRYGHGLEIVGDGVAVTPERVGREDDNLVTRALAATGRHARVRLTKRIPIGGGLGGGSSDAAAILRWSGQRDPAAALELGSDVPFCVLGGRARVSGLGEVVEPLPFEARAFVLLVPPLLVSTAAAYRAYDELAAAGVRSADGANDLTEAALAVEPRLARWRDALGEQTGQLPRLAGSGATWFVEGMPEALGLAGRASLSVAGETGRLVATRTVPAGWEGESSREG